MDVKICTKCNTELEATLENFYKSKNGKYGLDSRCKKCKDEYNKKYREKNREKDRETSLRYYYKNKEKVLEKQKTYYEENKNKILDYKKKIYPDIKERQALYKKEYYEQNRYQAIIEAKKYREENKELIKRRRKKRYKLNKDKILAQNREWRKNNKDKIRKYHEEYNQKNPHFLNEKESRRRARKKNAKLGRLPHGYRGTVFESNGRKCWWCGNKLESNWHVDHLIPLSRGGIHCVSNMVPSCPKCNLTKSDKMPYEFLNGRLL